MKSSDAFLYHIQEYLSDEKKIRKDLSKALYIHYFLFSFAALFLFLFRHQLPFPFPHFTIFCLVLFCVNIILHAVSLKREFRIAVFKFIPFFDTLAAPFIFLFTGGFLTPFIMTHLITFVGTSVTDSRKRNQSRYTFFILLGSYLSIAFLQKWEILPNYIGYSRTMMQKDLFFYFVVFITVSVIFLAYILVHIVSMHVSDVLNEMKNSFDSIMQSTLAETGTEAFDSLAKNLSETLQPRCVLLGALSDKGDSIHTVSVWERNVRIPDFDISLNKSILEDVLEQKKCILEHGARSRYPEDMLLARTEADFFYGIVLADANKKPIGVLCCISDKPIHRMYLVDPLATIFSSRAAAELDRIRIEEKQKAIETQLAHAHKMSAIGHLVSGIAHDFNNMVNIINGSAQMLHKKIKPDSSHQQYIQLILNATKHTTELVGQLTRFSRRDTSEISRIDVNKTVSDIVDLLGETTTSAITVTKKCASLLPVVQGNATQLANVLLNVGINGRDAMDQTGGGTLSFTTSVTRLERNNVLCESFRIDPGEYAVISISDTGSGMTPETREHLFEPFFTTKPKGKGTGLGLANVWAYLQNYKGAVDIQSTIGVGSTFTLYFPVVNKSSPAAPQTRKPQALSGRTITSVIVVDDDEALRSIMSEQLSLNGYTTHTFENGLDAVTFMKRNSSGVDLAILDMIMPGINGTETFTELRKINSGLPVLMISGMCDPEDLAIVLDQPGTSFLQKPFSDVQFFEALHRFTAPLPETAEIV